MDIYLLPRKIGKYLLYSKQFQADSSPDCRTDSASESEKSAKGKFVRLMKSGYHAGTAKRNRSEKLLKEMTALSQITVHYPANLSDHDAREIYDYLIQSQIKKHKRWLIVDGALLPVSAILTLVPGPNVLMAYLAWRTLTHYKTKKGGEKAVSDLEVSFMKDPQLEKLFGIMNRRFVFDRAAKIRAIGEEIGIANLDKLI